RHRELRLERGHLAPERVAADDDVHAADERLRAPGGAARQHDQPRARPEGRERALADGRPQRLEQAAALGDEPERGALPARDDQPVQALEALGGAHLARLGPDGAERRLVLGDGALDREDADLRTADHQPRVWSRPSSPSAPISMPGIASPRPSDTRVITSGSAKCVTASTIARARAGGLSLL